MMYIQISYLMYTWKSVNVNLVSDIINSILDYKITMRDWLKDDAILATKKYLSLKKFKPDLLN